MFKPTGSRTLAEVTQQQIRLGIQGYPGTGKTWAALTFPNPVVINFDRGLGAFTGNDNIIELPFYEEVFCKKVNPNHKLLLDTVIKWYKTEAQKLEADQTLIHDGGTGTENMYHAWYKENTVVTSSGKVDDFAQWRLKKDFFSELMEIFKKLKCHVIYICHETDKKDKDGSYSGKLRPLLTGQFVDQLSSHFTDWVRQLSDPIPDISKIDEKTLKHWDCSDKGAFSALMEQYFPDKKRNTRYYWCLESDEYFDGKVSSLVSYPKYIPAHYKAFQVYMAAAKKSSFAIPSIST